MFKKVARDIITSKREDFDSILKRGLQKQREEVASALRLFSYFDDWSEDTIKETCSVSNVRSYPPNKLVLDGTKGASQNFTYFILEGSCCVIHRLLVTPNYVAGQNKFKLHPDQNSVTSSQNIQNVYMQTCIFRAGVCFGLGENLRNKWIVSLQSVKCLRVPLHILMANNKGNVWCRIRQFLDMRFPSVEEVFKQFVVHRKWTDYRRQNFHRSITKRNIKSGTSHFDIPYCCRVNNEVSVPPVAIQPDSLVLKEADIKLLEEQNEIYEDFLDTLAHLKLRSVFK